MNKNRFRIIFSDAIGCLIPVSEITPASRRAKDSDESTFSRVGLPIPHPLSIAYKPIAVLLSMVFLPGALHAAQPDIQPDMQAPVSQRPNLVQMPNKPPVINIATPGNNGLSHNKFTELNASNGLVFNNSAIQTPTATANGPIAGNPALLSGHEAQKILAEVTGTHRSQLHGALEVAGKQADLLIANPNGLTLDGVSTINIRSMTAAAGHAFAQPNGDVQIKIDDTSGRVVIGDADLQDSKYFDVVARGVELNGKVDSVNHSTDINVTTGLGQYTAGPQHHWQPAAVVGKPSDGKIGISGAAAGSMYGGNITLVSSESGAGVMHAGAVHSLNDLKIDSQGDIVMVEADADHDLHLQAQRDVSITHAHVGRDATMVAGRGLVLQAPHTGSQDEVLSGSNLTLQAAHHIDVATTVSSVSVTMKSPQMKVTGVITGNDLLDIDTTTPGGSSGQVLMEGTSRLVYRDTRQAVAPGAHVERHDGKMQVQQPDHSWRRVIANYTGGMLQSGKSLNVNTGKLVNNGGQMSNTIGDVVVHANTLENLGSIVSGGNIMLDTTGDLINACASKNDGITFCDGMQSVGDLLLKTSGAMDNASGMLAGRDLNVTTPLGTQHKNRGELIAAHDLNIMEGSLDNSGTVSADHALNVDVEKLNNTGGMQSSDITVKALDIHNLATGNVKAINALSLDVPELDNAGSLIGKTVTLTNGLHFLNHDKGAVKASGQLLLNVADITNQDDGILQGGPVMIHASSGLTIKDKASIKGDKVELAAPIVSNSDLGVVYAVKDLKVTVNELANKAAMQSDDNALLTVNTGYKLTIDKNTYIPIAKNMLTVMADDLTVQQDAELGNPGSLHIEVSNILDNSGGIHAGKDIVLNSKDIINHDAAQIWGNKDVVMNVGEDVLNYSNAAIQSQQNLTITAGRQVTNNAGKLSAKGNLSIDSPLLQNQSAITGEVAVEGNAPEREYYYFSKHGGFLGLQSSDTDWYETLRLPLMRNNLQTGTLGVVEAGGRLQLNQQAQKGKHATVENHGTLRATGDINIDGNIDNSSANKRINYLTMLKSKNTASEIQYDPSRYNQDGLNAEHIYFNSLYDLLNFLFDGHTFDHGDTKSMTEQGIWKSDSKNEGAVDFANRRLQTGSSVHTPQGDYNGWILSLAKFNSPVLDAVLGADYKTLEDAWGYAEMKKRWDNFKASTSPEGQSFFGNKVAEIISGGSVNMTAGTYSTGGGAKQGMNETVNVQLGTMPMGTTLRPDLQANFNALDFSSMTLDILKQALNPAAQLAELTSNHLLFSRSPVMNEGAGDAPLYITKLPYIDPSQYKGAEYFFSALAGIDTPIEHPPQPSLKTPVQKPVPTVLGTPNNHTTKSTPVQPQIPPGAHLLGDAYFDHQLIIDTLTQSAGMLYDAMDENSRVETLMNNAADEAKRLRLTPGVALTQAQYDQLVHDIIWYEPQVVDGVTVLAPHIYLARSSLAALKDHNHHSAELVALKNVHMEASEVDNIDGVIKAKGNVAILSQGNVNNISTPGVNGKIEAGDKGRVTLVAKGTVNNQGADITGGDVKVLGVDGVNIATNMHVEQQNGHDKLVSDHNGGVYSTAEAKKTDPIKDKPDSAAKPANPGAVAKKPPAFTPEDPDKFFKDNAVNGPVEENDLGHVEVASNKDVSITGAKVGDKKNDVLIKAGGDLKIEDVHSVESELTQKESYGFLSHSSTTHNEGKADSEGGSLEAKNLTLDVGGNALVEGSNIEANDTEGKVIGRLYVTAGKNGTLDKTRVTKQGLLMEAGVSDGVDSAEVSNDDRGDGGDKFHGETTSDGNKTPGAQFKFGFETSDDTKTHETLTHSNSQLNLGSGHLKVEGVADLGGADINANAQLTPELAKKSPEELSKLSTEDITSMRNDELKRMSPEDIAKWEEQLPTLSITAKTIESTKEKDVDRTTEVLHEAFVGLSGEGHSSVLNTVATERRLQNAHDKGQKIDPGQTVGETVGDVSQLGMGETGGASLTFGASMKGKTTDSTRTKDNQSKFGGNLSLFTTDGDLTLNNTVINGGDVKLKAHNANGNANVNLNAGEGDSYSSTHEENESFGLTVSAGGGPTGAGTGISSGANGSIDDTKSKGKTFTSSQISGAKVAINSDHDVNLNGGSVQGVDVDLNAKHLNVISKQSTNDMEHTHGEWSVSAGMALSTDGGFVPTGSFSASGGKDWDHDKRMDKQSGITADHSLNGKIDGDVNLIGGHVDGGKGKNDFIVTGKIIGSDLTDSRDKDGFSAGGGGGNSKDGIPTVNIDLSRPEQIHYNATQHATFDVNGAKPNQGETGTVNHNQKDQTHINTDDDIAGNQMNLTFSTPTPGGKGKGRTERTYERPPTEQTHDVPVTHEPEPTNPTHQVTEIQEPEHVYNNDYTHVNISNHDAAAIKNPRGDQFGKKYTAEVLVKTDNTEATRRTDNLVKKNSDMTVMRKEGNKLIHESGPELKPVKGSLKIILAGHTDGGDAHGLNATHMNGMDGHELADTAKRIAKLTGKTAPERATLLGCGTEGCLTQHFKKHLETTEVSGQNRAVKVEDTGHKLTSKLSDEMSLGKPKPSEEPHFADASAEKESPNTPIQSVAKETESLKRAPGNPEEEDSPAKPNPKGNKASDAPGGKHNTVEVNGTLTDHEQLDTWKKEGAYGGEVEDINLLGGRVPEEKPEGKNEKPTESHAVSSEQSTNAKSSLDINKEDQIKVKYDDGNEIKNHLGDIIGEGVYGKVYQDKNDPNFVIKESKRTDNTATQQLGDEAERFAKYYGNDSVEVIHTYDNLYLRMLKVPGIPMKNIKSYPKGSADAFHRMMLRLESVGITHADMHAGNFMYSEALGEFFPIDLGSAGFTEAELKLFTHSNSQAYDALIDQISGRKVGINGEQLLDLLDKVSVSGENEGLNSTDLFLLSELFPSRNKQEPYNHDMLNDVFVGGKGMGTFYNTVVPLFKEDSLTYKNVGEMAKKWVESYELNHPQIQYSEGAIPTEHAPFPPLMDIDVRKLFETEKVVVPGEKPADMDSVILPANSGHPTK